VKIRGQPPIQPPPPPEESGDTKKAGSKPPRKPFSSSNDATLKSVADQRSKALSSDVARLISRQTPGPHVVTSKAGLLGLVKDIGADLRELDNRHSDFAGSAAKLGTLYDSLSQRVEEMGNLAASGATWEQLTMAAREMQEMNQSFSLQYLQLQQKMQADNRKYTLVSNIMKTKHETAKNAINNIR
jgi:hypothetical protein